MKKILVAAALSVVALVGCSASGEPNPVVTVTEQAPPPVNRDDGVVNNEFKYINFVRENGGLYGSMADAQGIVNLGNIVCEGYAKGLSEDDIVQALAYALVENDMNNEEGAKFAAAIIVGAERYLCGFGAV